MFECLFGVFIFLLRVLIVSCMCYSIGVLVDCYVLCVLFVLVCIGACMLLVVFVV